MNSSHIKVIGEFASTYEDVSKIIGTSVGSRIIRTIYDEFHREIGLEPKELGTSNNPVYRLCHEALSFLGGLTKAKKNSTIHSIGDSFVRDRIKALDNYLAGNPVYASARSN